jgi:uncharacterized protein
MFIQFTVSNFLSIKEPVTLNMTAMSSVREFSDSNIIQKNKLNLLKSAAIYGANASGKSKLLYALNFFDTFIRQSFRETQAGDKINVSPFKLNSRFVKLPSSFELSFLIGDVKYRYGFELDKNKIHTEWLFSTAKIKEVPLFIRQNQNFKIHKDFKEGKGLGDKTRSNALFISIVAQFNGEKSKSILEWFMNFNVISGMEDESYEGFTAGLLTNAKKKKKIMEFVTGADLGITGMKVDEFEVTIDRLPKAMPDDDKKRLLELSNGRQAYELFTLHDVYDSKGKKVGTEIFDFDDAESEGTKKYFRLAGPILDTLEKGGVLFIDELDARLHPILTKFIVKLFNSPKTNKSAQLVFVTHDTNLLSACNLRRDQIWFAEKDRVGATKLYSLGEYKLASGKVRNDASFEADYLKGRYGAIPYLGELNKLFY